MTETGGKKWQLQGQNRKMIHSKLTQYKLSINSSSLSHNLSTMYDEYKS